MNGLKVPWRIVLAIVAALIVWGDLRVGQARIEAKLDAVENRMEIGEKMRDREHTSYERRLDRLEVR